ARSGGRLHRRTAAVDGESRGAAQVGSLRRMEAERSRPLANQAHGETPPVGRRGSAVLPGHCVVCANIYRVRPMRPDTILWIYIILLVIGGLIGFLKAKSQISLISSVVFAALLILCQVRIIFQPYVADILLAVLLVMFAWRL